MMQLKAVIFDIDGTLIDTVDMHAKAWQEAFAYFGKDIPYDDVRQQIGKGGDQLMPVFFSKDELDKFGKELEEYRGEHFKKNYLPFIKGFPKCRELFERIHDDGKKIALASSAKEDELGVYKRAANIEGLVDVETSSADVDRTKPEPDIFEVALKELGVEPDEAIVVGDSPYDAIAAKRAGITSVGVLCGGFPEAELRGAGCVEIYRDPEDILRYYDHSPLAS